MVASLSKTLLKEDKPSNPLLRQASTFLERSEQSNSTLGSLLHASRGRILAANVVPATPLSMEIMEKCAIKFKNRQLVPAFVAWTATTAEKKRMKHLAEKCAIKFKNRQLVPAYVTWAETTTEKKQQRGLLAKVIGRLANQKVAAAVAAWKSMCLALAVRRVLLLKVIRPHFSDGPARSESLCYPDRSVGHTAV